MEADIHTVQAAEESKTRVLKDIAAGTAGGIAQTLAGNPFDTVKVRLQSSNSYSGPLDVVRKLVANEGPLAFYKGVVTPLVGIGACVSIQFAVNEYMKRFFARVNNDKPLSLGQFYGCGSAAGFANSFLASPIEHIRIRLQTQVTSGLYKGPLDCIAQIYRAGGVPAIFRGLGPTLVRESHGLGVYFASYEWLVQSCAEERSLIAGWKLCLFGGLSGVSLWLSVYPVDIIKTRLQTDNLTDKMFKNSWQCAKFVVRSGGVRALFDGFSVCLLRAFPANAVTFYGFELAMRALT